MIICWNTVSVPVEWVTCYCCVKNFTGSVHLEVCKGMRCCQGDICILQDQGSHPIYRCFRCTLPRWTINRSLQWTSAWQVGIEIQLSFNPLPTTANNREAAANCGHMQYVLSADCLGLNMPMHCSREHQLKQPSTTSLLPKCRPVPCSSAISISCASRGSSCKIECTVHN